MRRPGRGQAHTDPRYEHRVQQRDRATLTCLTLPSTPRVPMTRGVVVCGLADPGRYRPRSRGRCRVGIERVRCRPCSPRSGWPARGAAWRATLCPSEAQSLQVLIEADELGGDLLQFPRGVVPEDHFDLEPVRLKLLDRRHVVAVTGNENERVLIGLAVLLALALVCVLRQQRGDARVDLLFLVGVVPIFKMKLEPGSLRVLPDTVVRRRPRTEQRCA